jgi:thiamine biosynthesis lipoprotein
VSAPAGSCSFPALGATAALVVTDPEALADARALLERELEAIDLACSRFRPDSELTRLNAGSGSDVEVSALLLEALRVALRAAESSGGLVDPTVGKTMRLAGYDRPLTAVRARDGRLFVPSFMPAAGWRTVELSETRSTVRIPRGIELDLGATAKALAADRAARAAADATGTGVLVSLGGDIAVAGAPPLGGWSIRIADDHAAPLDAPGPAVSIVSGGLASSGTSVRRWATAGGELHHIVDPRTGRPAASPWRTVTVAAASCVDANTSSTAAVVLGEDAPAWLDERRLPARLVRLDGSVVRVGLWPAEAA